MSSPIDQSRTGSNEQRAKRATARARLAPFFGIGAGLIGLGIVAAFLFQSILIKPEAPKANMAIEKPKVEKVVSGQASRITGFDKNRQPFELAALNGIQDISNLDLVHLQTVTGTFHRDDGGAIGIASNIAQYDAKTKALDLQGKVTLREEGHYIAHMEAASVNVDDHSLISKTPVKVDTSSGTVEADGMTVGPYGTRIVFIGHVKANFATNSDYGVRQ